MGILGGYHEWFQLAVLQAYMERTRVFGSLDCMEDTTMQLGLWRDRETYTH